MIIEEKLKDLILIKYRSLREFSLSHDIPYTTLKSMLTRGIGNSSVTNVIKVCKALGISADALADGNIVYVTQRSTEFINSTVNVEVEDLLGDIKSYLITRDCLTINGKPITNIGINSLIDALDIGVEMAKKKNQKP